MKRLVLAVMMVAMIALVANATPPPAHGGYNAGWGMNPNAWDSQSGSFYAWGLYDPLGGGGGAPWVVSWLPEVYITSATSSGAGFSAPSGLSENLSMTWESRACWKSRSIASGLLIRILSTDGIPSLISDTMGAYSASMTSTLGRQSFTRNSTSSACHQQLIGTAMAPAFWVPKWV